MKNYEFDKSNFSFKKVHRSFVNLLKNVVNVVLISACIALVTYFILSTFIKTDTEKRLARENNMYEKVYAQMQEREQLIGDAVSALQYKDNQIYNEIFSADAPEMDPGSALGFLASSDTLPSSDIVQYSKEKSDALMESAARIENILSSVQDHCVQASDSLPPLSSPLKDLSYAQVAASVGEKVNPFYKVPLEHNGLDIIAVQGEPVYATASGYVSDVITSRKGQGNVVEITHPGGYITRYAHLSDIQVRKGVQVRKGACVGYVGISGNSFAPHLHYEVIKDGQYMDPVNFLFASVSPSEYLNMMYMSVNTGQSMD